MRESLFLVLRSRLLDCRGCILQDGLTDNFAQGSSCLNETPPLCADVSFVSPCVLVQRSRHRRFGCKDFREKAIWFCFVNAVLSTVCTCWFLSPGAASTDDYPCSSALLSPISPMDLDKILCSAVPLCKGRECPNQAPGRK